MSDYYVILISDDMKFSGEFLEYFVNRYGPRNRRGFAKVFAVNGFEEALALIQFPNELYVIVMGGNLDDGDASSFLELARDRHLQQLKLSNPKEIGMYERIFNRMTFFVLLEREIEHSADGLLPNGMTKVWHLGKPAKLEEIDALICPERVIKASVQWNRNPITYLPGARLLERKHKESGKVPGQILLHVMIVDPARRIAPYDYFSDHDVEQFVAELIEQAVAEHGAITDWIGHLVGDHFVVFTAIERVKCIRRQIQNLFDQEISAFRSSAEKDPLEITFECKDSLT